jgi:hypothetical protein
MKFSPSTKIAAHTCALTVLSLMTACASSPNDPATADGHKVLLPASEYETVYVTGSMLPVLVAKSPTVRPVPSIAPISTITGESFRKSIGPGRGPVIPRGMTR